MLTRARRRVQHKRRIKMLKPYC